MSVRSEALLDNLCDPALLQERDPLNMMKLVLGLSAQCRVAADIARALAEKPVRTDDIQCVVVTGLGGSAIGGDFARCLMEACGRVPLVVNRDYGLPRWVGPHTLVIAASYSGNTEETLNAYAEARAAGAQRAVVTSGGKLRELAEQDGVPVVVVPGGQPPRSATGYMFFPLVGLLVQRGLLDSGVMDDIAETLDLLDSLALRFGPDVPADKNPTKQMALALCGKLPIVYGSQGYRGAVAIRWKGQFNENSKIAAFANVLPEQNHNEALAWVLAARQAQNWSVIFLRDPAEIREQPRIARRVEVTRELLGSEPEIHEVWAEGKSLLARMFSLIYFADFLTVYLAYLNEICPTDMSALEYLKAELAKV